MIPELIRSSKEIWEGKRRARREAIYLIRGAYCSTICSCQALSTCAGQYSADALNVSWAKDCFFMSVSISFTVPRSALSRCLDLVLEQAPPKKFDVTVHLFGGGGFPQPLGDLGEG